MRESHKVIDYSEFFTILDEKQKGFNDHNYRMARCKLCNAKMKLNGIRTHLYHKHKHAIGRFDHE